MLNVSGLFRCRPCRNGELTSQSPSFWEDGGLMSWSSSPPLSGERGFYKDREGNRAKRSRERVEKFFVCRRPQFIPIRQLMVQCASSCLVILALHHPGFMSSWLTVEGWCGPWPVVSVCCGCGEQIHTDYRSPVEKGAAWPLSEWERGPRPLPGQAFIAFIGTLHWEWSSFTMHRFTVGGYLLQTTKERMLLITSKRRMLQSKGKSGYTPYFGCLAQTLGSYFKYMQ